MSGATLEQKNEVLELTKLEYHKKWYFPIYVPNSVSGLNISKINANGPFCPWNCNRIICPFSKRNFIIGLDLEDKASLFWVGLGL